MDKEKLLELYPEYTSVLGPYKRTDGRKHIVLNNSNASKGTKGKTKTISYPKALKEIEIGKRLLDNETIDHHDRNFNNDDSSNLVIKKQSIHAFEDALRVEVAPVKCAWHECSVVFIPTKAQRNKQSSGPNGLPAGPFCSNICKGKYGASVQNGADPLTRKEIIKKYYKIEK